MSMIGQNFMCTTVLSIIKLTFASYVFLTIVTKVMIITDDIVVINIYYLQTTVINFQEKMI